MKSENIPETQAVQSSPSMVKDEKSLLNSSTDAEQSAAEKESSPSKMGIKSTLKGKTPITKARTPSYLVRTPLQRGKPASPAVRSSAKSNAKSPTGVKRGTHTPLAGQRNTNSRNTTTVTPRSKTPAASHSSAQGSSALFADEIAELKLALTKPKGQTPARASALKTPVGTARFHSVTVKAKTPAAGDKTKTPSVTPRVQSNVMPTPKSKTLISASTLKTLVVTPAAKTPVGIKSKGLTTKTSSVHRVKTIVTLSPRAKAQKRRSSAIPSPSTASAKKSPLRNIVPQTDGIDASQNQQETVDSTLETSLGDRTSNETASPAGERSQRRISSPGTTLGRPKTGSAKISSPTGPPTRRKSLSSVTRSPGSSLTRSKSRSPRWGPAESSPRNISQGAEILTKARRSSSFSNAGANKVAKDSPRHQISSQASNLFPSQDQAEAVDSILESSLIDKASDEAVSPDGKSLYSPKLTPAEGRGRRKSRSSKVSSPGGRAARVKSQSPIVEAHANTKSPSPLARSPGSSLTRTKSQSPHGGPAKSRSPLSGSALSPAEKMSVSVETPVLHRRSSTRRSVVAKQSPLDGKSDSPLRTPAESSAEKRPQGVETPALPRRSSSRPSLGTKQSPLHEVLSQASGSNVPQTKIETVHSIAATSFTDIGSDDNFSPTDKKSKSPKLSPAEARSRKESLGSLTRPPLRRSKPQSPIGSSPELSAQKKSPTSKMSPVDEDKAKMKLQSELESPTGASLRMSRSPITSATRSKSQSPLRSPTEPSANKSLRHSSASPLVSLTRGKSQSPKVSPGETSARRKSQCLKVSSPLENQYSTPAVTDECFLESYEQQFSPLVLEMDDLDEYEDSSKKVSAVDFVYHELCETVCYQTVYTSTLICT